MILCQRREQFDTEALKREHGGDVKMPELLGRLVADCPRQKARAKRSASMIDAGRCVMRGAAMAHEGAHEGERQGRRER